MLFFRSVIIPAGVSRKFLSSGWVPSFLKVEERWGKSGVHLGLAPCGMGQVQNQLRQDLPRRFHDWRNLGLAGEVPALYPADQPREGPEQPTSYRGGQPPLGPARGLHSPPREGSDRVISTPNVE